MCTRSQSRNNFPQREASPATVEPLRIELPFQEDQFQEDPPEVSMADNRTMAQLLRAPTEGYEDAIVIPKIAANNFELKHGLINLVQNKQFFGHDKEDPHAHIRYFNKITSTIRVQTYAKANEAVLRNMKNEGQNLQIQMVNLTDMLSKFVSSNTASSSGGVAYQGPTIPTPSKVVKQRIEVTKDQVQTPSSQSTAPVQPLVVQSETQTPVSDPVVAPVSAPMPNLKPYIPYHLRRDNERRRDQANEQTEKFYKIFKDMSFEISFTDALILMPKFASTLKALIGNKENLSEMARTLMNEHCSAVILNKLPRKLGDLGKFLIPCEFPGMDECLALADLGASINLMPLSKEIKVYEAKTVKSSVDEPPDVELKDLPPYLDYAFLEGDNKLHVIIAKELGDEEKSALIKVLKSHKCMLAIFHDMLEKTMEVFMEDFLIFGNSFENCLSRLDKMLKMCEDTNLCLNWEKSHFMVKEGIVLGHKISKNGIEVDKAKVDVITKLPHPTTVKGAVLGQRHEKHFRPIHYASKMMTDAESNYTTTEKEMLAVVYAFEKLRSYLIMNKSIVHTDHSALKYLFAKKDAKARLLREKVYNVMRCLKTPSKFMKSLTFEALTLWARSRLHEGTNISSWPSIICRNGLKRKRSPSKTPELFASSLNLSSPDLVPLELSVTHSLSTVYYPQTSRQVEVSNRSLKRILERTIGENRASWSDKLDDALWAFRTAYKTPIGCTSYKLVYEKACHLLIELEHKAYWALKQATFDLAVAGDHRKVKLNELNELRDHAYENSLIYKEKTKRIHDSKIKNRVFNVGDRVLLFNSRLKIFSGKLKTRSSGPFTITKVFPYGTVELSHANGPNFKVNGHRVKHYFRGDVPQLVVPDLQTFPMDQ
nr:reverse transcriptase domain-containing protein [Tanacetum cinerariifolium]